jgi:hypothetical protein
LRNCKQENIELITDDWSSDCPVPFSQSRSKRRREKRRNKVINSEVILEALRKMVLSLSSKSGDLLLFLFTGHGCEEKNGYTWMLAGPRENEVNLQILDGKCFHFILNKFSYLIDLWS